MTSAAESYDLGQAVAHMTFQAQALGLHMHPDGGQPVRMRRDVQDLLWSTDPM